LVPHCTKGWRRGRPQVRGSSVQRGPAAGASRGWRQGRQVDGNIAWLHLGLPHGSCAESGRPRHAPPACCGRASRHRFDWAVGERRWRHRIGPGPLECGLGASQAGAAAPEAYLAVGRAGQVQPESLWATRPDRAGRRAKSKEGGTDLGAEGGHVGSKQRPSTGASARSRGEGSRPRNRSRGRDSHEREAAERSQVSR